MLHHPLCNTSTAQHYIGAESGRLDINTKVFNELGNFHVVYKNVFLKTMLIPSLGVTGLILFGVA